MSASVDEAYREIMSYLVVARETFDNGSNKEFPVTVRYIISNTRRKKSLPTITYKDVEAVIQTPGGEKVVAVGTLECEQTYEYTYSCRYADVTSTGCRLKGRISPEDFFAFENDPSVQTHSSLSPRSYMNIIGELDIHKWLRDLPKNILIPGPNTTLAELDAEQTRLAGIMREICHAREVFDRFAHMFEYPKGDDQRAQLGRHRSHVGEYLVEVEKEISKFRDSYRQQPSSQQKLGSEMVQRLGRRAESLDKETEALKNIFTK